MTKKIGVIMDPIESIHYKKDTTLGMLWEASDRGWEIFYIEPQHLFFRNQSVFANCQIMQVFRDSHNWFALQKMQRLSLQDLDVILMRKDPPFNLEYIYATYLLEHVEKAGTWVINRPQSLRDVNEKLFTIWFPQCCPPTLITRDIKLLKEFYEEQRDIVCKPPSAMGGTSIFRLKYPDENASVVFEVLSEQQQSTVIAQRYIPEIRLGDKRIIMINGEPIPYSLARIPQMGELRGNLAVGGKGVAQPLTERDYFIAKEVGPILREKGLYFVGLDVIGDFLTEINVTSPTCVREIEEQTQLNIMGKFFDGIEQHLRLS